MEYLINDNKKSAGITLILNGIFGYFGVDKFYTGATTMGFIVIALLISGIIPIVNFLTIPVLFLIVFLSGVSLVWGIVFSKINDVKIQDASPLIKYLYKDVNFGKTDNLDMGVIGIWIVLILFGVFGISSLWNGITGESYTDKKSPEKEKDKDKEMKTLKRKIQDYVKSFKMTPKPK